ncbi:Gfo/Idh/MocA family protein [Paracoccus sp. (in: a-proteobacteria)]|uniref:Gfo/Idh/MocA family protein n=1 Tax=Paracoccus sp. TaxID=267 RepID=UPI003A8AD1F7
MTARIGVVGIGWWATVNHIPTIRDCPEAEIVAICDLDAGRLKAAGDKFGIAARYQDLDQMLARERLDGVMVSTPHTAHAAPAIAALRAGCHVLVEKPMATTGADGRAIADAARAAGKEVIIPTAINFTRFTAQAVDWVRAGRIGRLRHAVCQMGSALDDLFAGQPMLETEGDLFRPPASTWADPARAGGYGWGQMSHSLAWLTHVGDLAFDCVCCMDGKSASGVDYYDAACARTTSGATVALSGSATMPKHKGLHVDIRLYGSEGVIMFDTERARLTLSRLDSTEEAFDITPAEAHYDGTLPVRAFARLCAGEDVVNASDAECGARVTEALEAMYRSAATGQLTRIGG